MKKSVYQSKDYLESLIDSGKKIIKINEFFFAIEKTISFLGIKKKILETRGFQDEEYLKDFKNVSKNYFYGTIASPVVSSNSQSFKKLGLKKFSNYTLLINLKKTEEELWKSLEKKSSRWGVKNAERNKLKFILAKEDEILKFHKIYENTSKEGRFESEKIDFFKNLRDTSISKLFLIKKDKEILAGGLILLDKDYNYSILDSTASSEEGNKFQAMPFLYWNLILYSKSLNLNYFDLGGYDKEASKGTKMENINKFKKRFGGEIREQLIYSTNWKYPFLRGLFKKFKFLKNIYKK